MNDNKNVNNEQLFLLEIENINESKDELLYLFEVFNEKSLNFEFSEINGKIMEIKSKSDNLKIFIYFIITNRLINISKNSRFKREITDNNKYLLELMILSCYLKEENIVEEVCKYLKNHKINSEENLFFNEISNMILKIPTILINIALILNKNSNNFSSKLIDKYIPYELQEENYYIYIWKSILKIIKKDLDLECFNFLKNLFKRLFVRGYKDYLCKIVVNINLEDDFFEIFTNEENFKLIIKIIFLNIMTILKEDNVLIYSFVKQLFKEIENSKIIQDKGNILITPKTKNEMNLILNLFSTICEYFITDENIKTRFLIDEIFSTYKKSFSLNICLSIIDFSLMNIDGHEINKTELLRNFDYIEYSKKKLYSPIKFNNSKFYVDFYKELLKNLSLQWSSFESSMNFTLNLSTIIIRITSILIYLNSGKIIDVKELLLDNYQNITNGIQSRLKNIDPIIRACAMYLGEFYFNLLIELFPNQNSEDDSYLTNQVPKFNELKSLNRTIKKQLNCLFNSHKSLTLDECTIQNCFDYKTEDICTKKMNTDFQDHNSKRNKKFDISQTPKQNYSENNEIKNDIFDQDDLFWEKVPSVKNIQKTDTKNQTVDLKTVKTVNMAFDLINYYMDEKKSSNISNKDEKLLDVLKHLSDHIETDTSNYNYIIFPLIDKIITLKKKDQRYIVLTIISKLIQFKTNFVSIEVINYACNLNNVVSMDTRILLFNSLILACQNLSNTKSNNISNHSKNKSRINLFDQYSLLWSSNLTKNIINIIKQSQSNLHEKIPNIFFITLLELFNHIILSTSSNNVNIDQITYFGFEFISLIDIINSPLFQDTTIRKSIYILAFNITQKYKQSSQKKDYDLISQIGDWFLKIEKYELDLNCINIINQVKSCITMA